MSKYDLSILIPSRNEEFLGRTIQEVLTKRRGSTEVIAVLDGAWPVEPLEDHPDVTIIHHAVSIGQRAAQNEAARLSTAKFVMKLDAHCALDEGFDVKLMEACDYDTTLVPRLYNLHAFDWVCNKCAERTYQGPQPSTCQKCGEARGFTRDIVWQPRWSRKTDFMRFDKDLVFKYWGDYGNRPEAQGDVADTMSLLGACFFMHRKRYWELDGADLAHGSWGQQGSEVSLKSWLSGGRLAVLKTTWFSHLFRTQPGFNFPYPVAQSAVEKARAHSRDLWLNNKWKKQVRPLSWVIDKFWPVPSWSEDEGKEMLARVRAAGEAFTRSVSKLALPVTDHANPDGAGLTGENSRRGQGVAVVAMGLPDVARGDGVAAAQIAGLTGQEQMCGVAAGRVVADDVVEDGDALAVTHRDGGAEPSVHQARQAECLAVLPDEFSQAGQADLAVPVAVAAAIPNPTSGLAVDGDVSEQPGDGVAVEMGNREILKVSHDSASNAGLGSGPEACLQHSSGPHIISNKPSFGVVFYTDNRCPEPIFSAVTKQLQRCVNGNRIVSVSLQPIDFGDNIVLGLERGILTMFRQILAGLADLQEDYVFMAEHDVIYHPSHHQFVPPTRTAFYYNMNVWKVDAASGHAIHYLTKQTSGLCADRELLVSHYRRRIEKVEQNARDLIARGEPVKNDGFSRHMGFEPGCHRPPRGVDNYPAFEWWSEFPNVDVRHTKNLTASRWAQDQFRDPKACLGWKEGDSVPGWGRTEGRFDEFLREVIEGRVRESQAA